jgi:pimeloyl-ACP methyl ester carboxylesterase
MQRFARAIRGAALALALFAGVLNAQEDKAPPFPPPGRLVDIGGWRLHLNCTGTAKESQPTVILEAGIGDFSVEWSLVQPGVARFARVCSYDRADDGWSDYGPHPRTMQQVVYELHKLLETAEVRPPYVMVGHSYGGLIVRLYQSTYPKDVAGIVLVEAGADNPWRMLGDGRLVRASELATGRPIPDVKMSGPLRASDIPPQAVAQMRAAGAKLVAVANEAPRNKLPDSAQQMRTWAFTTLKHWATSDNPFEPEELVGLMKDRAARAYPLGDLPLIVITRGIGEDTGPDSKTYAEDHRRDHETIAKMSRLGKVIVAEKSGHHVQLEQPELVVQAIRQVIGR